MIPGERKRCWGDGDELMAAYHDLEWGGPPHDDAEINRDFS